jgi:hypothetical protein
VALEGCLALHKPAGELQEIRRMVAGKSESGVDERIRLDQRAVEIDAEGQKRDVLKLSYRG